MLPDGARRRMGFRFRKSLRIAPGVRLNFSRSGISTSVGPRGAKLTVGPKGTRTTVGIPGSGMSWSQQHRRGPGAPRDTGQSQDLGKSGGCGCAIMLALFIAVLARCGGPAGVSTAVGGAGGSERSDTITQYVSADRTANCRQGAGTDTQVSERLSRGTAVDVIEATGSWSKVRRPVGECWVSTALLSGTMPAAAQSLYSDGPKDSDWSSRATSGASGSRSSGGSRRARAASSGSVYFANCSAARAAGAAPVYAGDPGYAPKLDRDGDGIGCE
jgi:SH3-like domain-containing protein